MKIFRLIAVVLVLSVAGCNKESDVDPATGTFIRYFSSENNNDAVTMVESDDGFTLLSNVEIQVSATAVQNRIKVTKTDEHGKFLWEKSFPDFDINADYGMKGSSIIYLPGSGYLIIGDSIYTNNGVSASDLLLIRINGFGELEKSVTIAGSDLTPDLYQYGGKSLSGRAVAHISAQGTDPEYFAILGSIKESPNDMFLARVNFNDLSLEWDRKYYGDGTNVLINKLYTNSANNLIWGASVSDGTSHDVRVIEAPADSEVTINGDPFVVTPTINEMANDFCKVVGGWAVVGSTNIDGDDDISLLRISSDGVNVTYQKNNVAYNSTADEDSYDVNNGIADPDLNDKGNSVCQANDGSLMILGTVETEENQQEIFLMKLDAITNKGIWRRTYGGGDRDEASSIIALKDGSYLVFGTTSFGRSRKLMLMKLNADGQL